MEVKEKENYSLLKNDFFIKRISGKYIINSIIATLFVFASSFIDTLLVGIYMGSEGLSAMSLVSPVYLVYYTVGATLGIGGSILASRVLGKGETENYRKIFTLTAVTLGVCAVIMTAFSYVLFTPILNALCGSVKGVQREMAAEYLKFYFPGGACTLMTYVPLYFLKTDGKPKVSSRLFTLSAVMNVALSWLFMSPIFNMGVAGAACATSVSMGTVAILGFICMLHGKTELHFVKNFFSFSMLKSAVVSGIPNGMTNLLNSARILFVNMLLIYSGTSALLSCYTVVRNVSDILNSVILGISSAIIPLVGVFFGERDYEGNRSVMRLARKIGLTVMIPLVLVTCVISKPLFLLFGITDPAVITEGYWAIPLACTGLIIGYINVLYIGYLTAIKHEVFATVLVALRLLGAVVLFAFPFSRTIGSKGIWLSLSLAEIFTFAVFLAVRGIIRKKHKNLDALLLDTEKEREGDITFSVRNDVNDIVYATEQISTFCDDNGISIKTSMKVSLAIEEILTFLNAHCLSNDENSYTDVRVYKENERVTVRFRYVGVIYDPTNVYKENQFNEEMEEELLGIKMIMKSAANVDFRKTLGANNLIVSFSR